MLSGLHNSPSIYAAVYLFAHSPIAMFSDAALNTKFCTHRDSFVLPQTFRNEDIIPLETKQCTDLMQYLKQNMTMIIFFVEEEINMHNMMKET